MNDLSIPESLRAYFAGLDAEWACSAAFHDNESSRRVSQKLGYEEVGRRRVLRRGEPDWMVDLRLARSAWEARRRDDIEIVNLEPCLDMFGLS